MANVTRVLVIGATGSQGGSVARHLLRSGRYEVRCLTRSPQSPQATALREQGAEVVPGDLDDPRSLRAALTGCGAVFGVTNYWEHFGHEVVQGRNLVNAIADSGVQHTVLSTLPHTKLLSGGRLEVPHFDTKAHVEEYARGMNIPATYVHVAFYYENFLRVFTPHRRHGGSYAFSFPQGSTPLATVAVEDLGGVVAAILAESFWYRDKVIGAVGDDLRCDEYAEIMSRVVGRQIVYEYVAAEHFAPLGAQSAVGLANMFEFFRRYVPNRRVDLLKSRELYPEIRSFERWLRGNAATFKRALDT